MSCGKCNSHIKCMCKDEPEMSKQKTVGQQAEECVKTYELTMMNADTQRMSGQHYMKYSFEKGYATASEEIEVLKAKLEKLKQLVLLVDPVVSGVVVNDVALDQWAEFIKCFPDEN